MQTTILLVRHGQTEWNRSERFRGRYDIPLNQTGMGQAQKTARRIAAQWMPSGLLSSPLSRAMQTADAIAQTCGLEVEPCPGLVDIDYGKWQGLTNEEASQKWPDLVTAWFDHPEGVHIPGGESLAEVRQRAVATLEEIWALRSGETVVLVSHTVVNRLILLEVLGLGNERFWHLRQEPCAINVIQHTGGETILAVMNDTGHLTGM